MLRMTLWRPSVLTLILGIVAVGCAGPGTTGGPNPAPAQRSGPKRIIVGVLGAPYTFSDTVNQAGAGGVPGTAELERMVNSGLSDADKLGVLRPQLAEAIPTPEN